jgi:regulator of protease activity HflC (stomatin/prohibitin superfamily)
VALLAVKTVRIIPQARAANVERFGRYRRTLQVSFEDQPVTMDNADKISARVLR